MVIETKRLILRPFLEADATDVYEYLKEPAVNCSASMKLHSLNETKAEMKKHLEETEYCFAITLKDGGKVIGEMDTYLDDSRDLSRARCKMKKYCQVRGCATCGDYGECEFCEIIQSFLNPLQLQVRQIQAEAGIHIRANGHAAS